MRRRCLKQTGREPMQCLYSSEALDALKVKKLECVPSCPRNVQHRRQGELVDKHIDTAFAKAERKVPRVNVATDKQRERYYERLNTAFHEFMRDVGGGVRIW